MNIDIDALFAAFAGERSLADDLYAKLDRLLGSLPEHWHDDATVEAADSLARYREARQQ